MPPTPVLADAPTAPRTDPRAEDLFRIFVSDLEVACSIGVHAHERGRPQKVRVNADLWTRKGAAPLDDDIANVVSYEDVVTRIETLLGRGHINLVETAAEEIAAACLADPRVLKVRIRIEKLEVFANAAGAGVEVIRHRDGDDDNPMRLVAPPVE